MDVKAPRVADLRRLEVQFKGSRIEPLAGHTPTPVALENAAPADGKSAAGAGRIRFLDLNQIGLKLDAQAGAAEMPRTPDAEVIRKLFQLPVASRPLVEIAGSYLELLGSSGDAVLLGAQARNVMARATMAQLGAMPLGACFDPDYRGFIFKMNPLADDKRGGIVNPSMFGKMVPSAPRDGPCGQCLLSPASNAQRAAAILKEPRHRYIQVGPYFVELIAAEKSAIAVKARAPLTVKHMESVGPESSCETEDGTVFVFDLNKGKPGDILRPGEKVREFDPDEEGLGHFPEPPEAAPLP
jgi:hypothetical protein